MALYGAPLSHEDDAARAVKSAMDICQVLEKLNDVLQNQGVPKINIGIGLNTGIVVAGNMGSITRLNYSVIGDTVNLAARLEGLTKVYGIEVIVSESTKKQTPGLAYRRIDRVQVKGKENSVNIYQPMGFESELTAEQKAGINEFHTAVDMYQNQMWSEAIEVFERFAEESPALLYELYINRCKQYQLRPPGPDWDGTTKFDLK